MKNFITLFILALTIGFTVIQPAQAIEGGHEGNGGAGISINGRYMTFYTAGLYTEPQPMDGIGPDVIPGVNDMIAFVQKFPYWTADEKAALMNTVMPSATQEYYKVKGDQFGEDTKARLLEEFSRVTHQPTSGLELFAVTDTQKRQTFLLPAFYTLSPADQVAIMFHETYWLLFPNTDYNTVVSTEMAFEAVYVEPSNSARMMDLLSKYGDSEYTLQVMAKADQESGALNGLLTRSGIPMSKILGDALVKCKGNTCVTGMVPINLYQLVQKYPKSLLLNRLWKASQIESRDGHNDGATLHMGCVSTLNLGSLFYFEHDDHYECPISLNQLSSPILDNSTSGDDDIHHVNGKADLADCYLTLKSTKPGYFDLSCPSLHGGDYLRLSF